ncbi:MAG TPA: hypothetical protein VJX67_16270 [Blastocatellia bacterium]|nr:hypothetical protein [Blastocatellia bacterium]
MEDAIVAAVVETNTRLTAGKIGTGSIQLEGFNHNRQPKLEPKPSDKEATVMRFDDMSGKPLAILANWAAHTTDISALVPRFTADYVGFQVRDRKTDGSAGHLHAIGCWRPIDHAWGDGLQASDASQGRPTAEAVAEGGHGTGREVSPVTVGAEEQIMDQALIWIYQMMGEIK